MLERPRAVEVKRLGEILDREYNELSVYRSTVLCYLCGRAKRQTLIFTSLYS